MDRIQCTENDLDNHMISPAQLVADYEALKQRESQPSAEAPNNRASILGHPCTAYCYFNRVVPASKRAPVPARLARVFAEGKEQERVFQNDLRSMGYDLSLQQKPLYWPAPQISGHLDWVLSKGDSERVRCEFKSCAPFTFNSLHSVEDVKNHKWAFVRKWYGQILLYCLMDGEERYWLILKNKSTGEARVIEFAMGDVELQEAENLVKKAELVNLYVQEYRQNAAWTIPENEKVNDPRMCPECEFMAVCGPTLHLGPGLQVVTDGEIEKMLDRRGELEAGAGEFEELDGELKEYFKGRLGADGGMASCGDWFVEVKRTVRKDKVTVTRVDFYKPTPACESCGAMLPSVRRRPDLDGTLCVGCYSEKKEKQCQKPQTKKRSRKLSPATSSGPQPSRSVHPSATPQP